MIEKKYTYDYPRASITTDSIIFSFDDKDLKVLLIERAQEPCKGQWAFPGGFLDMDETAEACAVRELEEETALKELSLEQLGAFSALDRDPRGRTVTIAYIGVMDNVKDQKIKANDDAKSVAWFSLNELPDLAFDHADIMQAALGRLKTKARFRAIDLSVG